MAPVHDNPPSTVRDKPGIDNDVLFWSIVGAILFFIAVALSAILYMTVKYYRDKFIVTDEEAPSGNIFTKMKPKKRIRFKPRFKALLGRVEVAVSLPVSVCSGLRCSCRC